MPSRPLEMSPPRFLDRTSTPGVPSGPPVRLVGGRRSYKRVADGSHSRRRLPLHDLELGARFRSGSTTSGRPHPKLRSGRQCYHDAVKRIMVQADERLIERARQRASERGVSIAQVFREALERDLGSEQRPPALTSVGVVSSERGDLSRRASDDEYEPQPFR